MVLEHERQNGLTPIQEDSQSGRWQKEHVVRNNALFVEKLVTQYTFVTGSMASWLVSRKISNPVLILCLKTVMPRLILFLKHLKRSHRRSIQLMDMLKKVNMAKASGSMAGSSEEHVVNQLLITSTDEGNATFSIVNNCSLIDEISHVPWVIDSGTTDHICNDLRLFNSYYEMKSIVVRLPNGCFVSTNMAGIVRVNDELVLRVREKTKKSKNTNE